MTVYDVAVIGGGFYGCRIAMFWASRGKTVALIDANSDIMQGASYINQARVHNGYHYPRSLSTARGAHMNYERFCSDYRASINGSFTHVYAIAARRSFITSAQFVDFCQNADIPLSPVPTVVRQMFNRHLIEDAFSVNEAVFNAAQVRADMRAQLDASSTIALLPGHECLAIKTSHKQFLLHFRDRDPLSCRGIINAAYANCNHVIGICDMFGGKAGPDYMPITYELTELALISEPSVPSGPMPGITVMDGPFFSLLPFPARNLWSLSHVRYTPHFSWDFPLSPVESTGLLRKTERQTRFAMMQADVRRYISPSPHLNYVNSLMTIKAIPANREMDDGRPICIKIHSNEPFFASVLGSKLDGIYSLEEVMPEWPI
jgi:hypothetical protein